MDIQNAKQILGFDPNSQPAPEEVDQAYSKALSSLIKAEFSGEDVSEKREALELALQTISQPVRDNQVSSAPLVPHMPTATYQKPDQAPIPVIHISDWSGAGQARINYLTCPFCYTEVAEGFQVCPNCHNQVARTCPSCGSWTSVASELCNRCGAPMAIVAANRFNQAELVRQKIDEEQTNLARANEVNEEKNREFMTKGAIFWLIVIAAMIGFCVLGLIILEVI
ncbi:MAG: zinc ribbon domain-containing protein [Anaerolineaceae bacterium]|jgi:rRNA maturation protein Nop10|nr:zinc ribbon domain-containing protein [Anaerolineaceae bacterium]MDD4043483.1 zinc ribbon domain-containing protein [Anaerolineaceae bacterium]MDD4578733.1 zinc ribbon domain-containing protein [Anaerolineaceae bacterium]